MIAMKYLTIQAFVQFEWIDIAVLVFDDENKVIDLSYIDDYAFEFLNRDDKHAVSVRYPVSYYLDIDEVNWLSFLDDLRPSGAGRNYWLDYLDLHRLDKGEQAYQLLRHGTVAPIGNMRIKESIENLPEDTHTRYFDREDAENRSTDFLEYAQERGTIVGGATGAGGEAPKPRLRHITCRILLLS